MSSPVSDKWQSWREALKEHPDRVFSTYVLDGLRCGFRVGFDYASPLCSATRNMQSAHLHPTVIADYVQGEVSHGRILGPFQLGSLPEIHVNRMGVIPKGRIPGKWRLITDLSFPEGGDVNSGISDVLCSL